MKLIFLETLFLVTVVSSTKIAKRSAKSSGQNLERVLNEIYDKLDSLTRIQTTIRKTTNKNKKLLVETRDKFTRAKRSNELSEVFKGKSRKRKGKGRKRGSKSKSTSTSIIDGKSLLIFHRSVIKDDNMLQFQEIDTEFRKQQNSPLEMFLYDTEQDLTNVLDVAKVKKWKVTSVAWVPQKDGHFGPNMMNLLGDSLRVPVVVNLEGLEQVSLQVLFAERMKQQVATTRVKLYDPVDRDLTGQITSMVKLLGNV